MSYDKKRGYGAGSNDLIAMISEMDAASTSQGTVDNSAVFAGNTWLRVMSRVDARIAIAFAYKQDMCKADAGKKCRGTLAATHQASERHQRGKGRQGTVQHRKGCAGSLGSAVLVDKNVKIAAWKVFMTELHAVDADK